MQLVANERAISGKGGGGGGGEKNSKPGVVDTPVRCEETATRDVARVSAEKEKKK